MAGGGGGAEQEAQGKQKKKPLLGYRLEYLSLQDSSFGKTES